MTGNVFNWEVPR